jgi:hypothetical protein
VENILAGTANPPDGKLPYSRRVKTGKINRNQYKNEKPRGGPILFNLHFSIYLSAHNLIAPADAASGSTRHANKKAPDNVLRFWTPCDPLIHMPLSVPPLGVVFGYYCKKECGYAGG